MSDFEIRTGTAKDHALIYRSATRSLWPTPYFRDVPGDQWAEIAKGIVTRMLQAPWKLTIATPNGFPTEVAGFVTHRQTTTHKGQVVPVVGFLYVKEPYRRQGVARSLLESVTRGRPDFLAVLPSRRCWAGAGTKG